VKEKSTRCVSGVASLSWTDKGKVTSVRETGRHLVGGWIYIYFYLTNIDYINNNRFAAVAVYVFCKID